MNTQRDNKEMEKKDDVSLDHSGRDFFRILVLRGGPSAEREVSLAGGGCVAAALRREGHEVVEADIHPGDLTALDTAVSGPYEMVFPVLHGTFGEDGQLQEILEARGIRFVGSGSASSRLAMNKFEAKNAFEQAGLRVARDVLVEKAELKVCCTEMKQKLLEEVAEAITYPCVIKPNEQGSSVGVSLIEDKQQLVPAIQEGVERYGDCLVEEYIQGREFTVGVVGPQVLPVLEVRPAEGFYDYQAKYQANDTKYVFDLDLEEGLLKQMQEMGQKAFEALGCRDLGRVDLILSEKSEPYVLEVNTIPGFTDHSLVPKAAGRIGLTMEKLCDQIVRIAWSRPI